MYIGKLCDLDIFMRCNMQNQRLEKCLRESIRYSAVQSVAALSSHSSGDDKMPGVDYKLLIVERQL
jgi:hypothetical protein